jgi:replicative DNA helicase
MSYTDQLKDIKADLLDMELGIKRGWTWGFRNIDNKAGRIRKGQLMMLGGYSGCFAKGTPVLTINGYKNIEDLKVGDLVATLSDKIEYNPIDFVRYTCNQPKPMIQFNYDNETITATYDHPFFDGKKYYPLHYLIWGKMDASQRAQLKLLCKQYGQTLDHKTVRPLSYSDTQTWEGQRRSFENGSEWENGKGSQGRGASLDTKPLEFAVHQSQRLRSSEQCCRESGMVYAETEQPTRLQEWAIKRIFAKSTASLRKVFSRGNNWHQKLLAGINPWNTKESYSEEKRCIKSIKGKIQSYSQNHNQGYSQRNGCISKIQIKEAEPYYGIGIKNVHTYIVGRSQLPVHNTGKSAFILNMIDNILSECRDMEDDRFEEPRIAIFSTELTGKAYILRHLLLRMGVYQLQLEQSPQVYADKLRKEMEKWEEERTLNPDSLRIFGNISSYEDIVARLKKMKEMELPMPNLIFIDYVQELSANKMYDAKDTMPFLAKAFKEMAVKDQCAIVAVSQINNYGMQSSNNPGKTQLMPFSFGKEMSNASHTAILLRREKEEGELNKTLQVHIVKAREGMTGQVELDISDGYKLYEIS